MSSNIRTYSIIILCAILGGALTREYFHDLIVGVAAGIVLGSVIASLWNNKGSAAGIEKPAQKPKPPIPWQHK